MDWLTRVAEADSAQEPKLASASEIGPPRLYSGSVQLYHVPSLAIALAGAALAQQEGMIPRWQVEELSQSVVQNMETARKVVAQLRPQEWIQDGAPGAYVDQHQALLREMEQVTLAAQALGRDPERLTYAMDTFLWLDRTDSLMGSIAAGTRQYYNAAVAELLDSARNRNADGIATVKQYLRQLAEHLESSMSVAHREAQRCREEIVSRPPAGQ